MDMTEKYFSRLTKIIDPALYRTRSLSVKDVIRSKSYLSDFLRCSDWFGQLLELVDDRFHSEHDSSADLYGVGTFADGIEALLGNGPCQYSGGGGAVTRFLVCVISHILHQPRPDVLVLVFKVNAFGNCDAIFGDLWAAPALLDDNCATLTNDKDIKDIYIFWKQRASVKKSQTLPSAQSVFFVLKLPY